MNKDLRFRMFKALLEFGFEYGCARDLAYHNIKEALNIVNKIKQNRRLYEMDNRG